MNLGATIRINKVAVTAIGAAVLVVVLLYKNSLPTSNLAELQDGDSHVSLKKLLSAAIDAAERGGTIVRDIRLQATLHEQSKGKTKEGANDPVTDGDLKSHLTMFHSLSKAFPGVQVISEEHDTNNVDVTSVASASTISADVESTIKSDEKVPVEDIRIWIDPLDATQEYTEDLRQYVTTMVCVAVKGYPTIGVIHKPFENFTAWGWVGKGVAAKLHVTGDQGGPKDDISHIIVSRSHAGDVEAVAKQAFGDQTVVIPAGGAGFKTLAVIQGDADAYVHVTLIKKWDLCAGNAILNALNGKMTNLQGDPIDYGNKEQYKNEGGVLATLYQHDYYLPKLQVLKKS
ncbi:Inositol monophosphatase 3 [Halocaridina rubra]|uniref:Putative inositol monophosphatase 3 n=1 Tax=Halocaridina rubra TaxID=373956 RepID=A0AAN8X6K9_HALRR